MDLESAAQNLMETIIRVYICPLAATYPLFIPKTWSREISIDRGSDHLADRRKLLFKTTLFILYFIKLWGNKFLPKVMGKIQNALSKISYRFCYETYQKFIL